MRTKTLPSLFTADAYIRELSHAHTLTERKQTCNLQKNVSHVCVRFSDESPSIYVAELGPAGTCADCQHKYPTIVADHSVHRQATDRYPLHPAAKLATGPEQMRLW